MRIRHEVLLALVTAAAWSCSRPQPPADTTTTAQEGGAAAHVIRLQGDFTGPLGLQLWSVRVAMPTDVPGTLRRVHDLGFREVELAGTYGMGASEFRTRLDSAGLRATSMHAAFEQFRDSLATVLADARALGVTYAGAPWIPHPNGPITASIARDAAARFNAWGRAARRQGVQFFYHCHGYEFVPDAAGTTPMDILMRETDPDAVVFQMDVFWVARAGADPVAWLRKYPGRWRLIHLKDMRQGTPTNVSTGGANPDSTEVPIGAGQIDYRGVLRAARETGVQRFYIEDETTTPFAGIARSIAWLERVS